MKRRNVPGAWWSKVAFLLILTLMISACAPAASPAPAAEEAEPAAAEAEEAPTEVAEEAPAEEASMAEEGETVMVGAFDVGPGGCPQCFNPHTATGGFTWLEKYYDKLILYDVGFAEFQGHLADSWEISDDGTVYTFNLRDDVVWHDGEPFTAEDVAFTLQLVLTPDYASRLANQIKGIAGTEEYQAGDAESISGLNVVDDTTIEITLSEPQAQFLDALTEIIMIPEHALSEFAPADLIENEWWRTNPVGTGPFKWDKRTPDQSNELVANDDYFLGRPALDRLINRYFTEPGAAVLALESGEIDFTYVTGDEVARLQEQAGIGILEGPSQVVNFLAPNQNTSEAMANPLVRQAMMYAIDRDAIIETLFGGAAQKVNCPYSNPAYAPDDMNQYEYNPDRARELLDEAGYGDGLTAEFETLTYYTDQLSADVLVAMQQYLSDVGIDVTIRNVDVPTFITEYYDDNSFSLAYVGAANGPDPGKVRQYFHSDAVYPAGANALGYASDSADSLLDTGGSEVDPATRAGLYQDLCRTLNEAVPWIFLWETIRYGAVDESIQNFVWTPAPGGGRYYDQAQLWDVAE